MVQATYVGYSGKVELTPDVTIFEEVTARLADYHGFDVDATIRYNGQRLEVTELVVRQRPGGPPVTGEALRKVTVAAIIRNSVRTAMQLDRGWPVGTAVVALAALTTDDAARLRNLGPQRETLQAVAAVYRLADAIGDPPTKAVRESFGISQSTAGAWIGRARAADLLPPVDVDERTPELPPKKAARGRKGKQNG